MKKLISTAVLLAVSSVLVVFGMKRLKPTGSSHSKKSNQELFL